LKNCLEQRRTSKQKEEREKILKQPYAEYKAVKNYGDFYIV
jgi:hypothetical protein